MGLSGLKEDVSNDRSLRMSDSPIMIQQRRFVRVVNLNRLALVVLRKYHAVSWSASVGLESTDVGNDGVLIECLVNDLATPDAVCTELSVGRPCHAGAGLPMTFCADGDRMNRFALPKMAIWTEACVS